MLLLTTNLLLVFTCFAQLASQSPDGQYSTSLVHHWISSTGQSPAHGVDLIINCGIVYHWFYFIQLTICLYSQIPALPHVQANCLLFTSQSLHRPLESNTPPFHLTLSEFSRGSLKRLLWTLWPTLTFSSLAVLYHLKSLHTILIVMHTQQYHNSLIYIAIISSTKLYMFLYVFIPIAYNIKEQNTIRKTKTLCIY